MPPQDETPWGRMERERDEAEQALWLRRVNEIYNREIARLEEETKILIRCGYSYGELTALVDPDADRADVLPRSMVRGAP